MKIQNRCRGTDPKDKGSKLQKRNRWRGLCSQEATSASSDAGEELPVPWGFVVDQDQGKAFFLDIRLLLLVLTVA